MKKLLLLSMLLTVTLFAEVKTGQQFPDLTLSDQFGKSVTVNSGTRTVLMAFEKETAINTAAFFKQQKKGFMAEKHVLYISDISTMPSFITSMFALPKMKKYPFSVLLIRDDSGKIFARKEGKVTRYSLKNRVITGVDFLDPKQLSNVLEK